MFLKLKPIRKFRSFKRSQKTLLIVVVLVAIAAGFIIKGFVKKEKSEFVLEKVLPGTVIQEVSETGVIKVEEETNLGFKTAGRIEKIYVKEGDEVFDGQFLAKLEAVQTAIQLQEAQAALEVAQAQYNKLLAGSSQEEIKVAETAAANAEIALKNSQQNLEDVELTASQDLKEAYEDALNTLDDSYLKIYNASNTVENLYRAYFFHNDQESLRVRENKDKINSNMIQAKQYLDSAKADSKEENVDKAISEMKNSLSNVSDALKIIRDMANESTYYYLVSSADKTSLDTQKGNVNTALANTTSSQQTILSTKISNQSKINAAQAQKAAAQGALSKAQDELLLKKAGPRQEDVELYQAQVKQARAKAALLQDQLQEATLKSPVKGRVAKVNKENGETIQPTEFIISLIPANPLQIKVDIYEEDVVKVKVGDSVDVIIAALPDKTLKGKVSLINPAEKLVENVVYYEVTILPTEEWPQKIKPGMTADIVIKTDSRENVLTVSKRAIKKRDGKTTVEIMENGKLKEKEIEIGLIGSDDKIEIISGLEQGQEVVIR